MSADLPVVAAVTVLVVPLVWWFLEIRRSSGPRLTYQEMAMHTVKLTIGGLVAFWVIYRLFG